MPVRHYCKIVVMKIFFICIFKVPHYFAIPRNFFDPAGFATAGNSPPTATIASPSSSLRWKVGDTVSFSGGATDAQSGTLPASALLCR